MGLLIFKTVFVERLVLEVFKEFKVKNNKYSPHRFIVGILKKMYSH